MWIAHPSGRSPHNGVPAHCAGQIVEARTRAPEIDRPNTGPGENAPHYSHGIEREAFHVRRRPEPHGRCAPRTFRLGDLSRAGMLTLAHVASTDACGLRADIFEGLEQTMVTNHAEFQTLSSCVIVVLQVREVRRPWCSTPWPPYFTIRAMLLWLT